MSDTRLKKAELLKDKERKAGNSEVQLGASQDVASKETPKVQSGHEQNRTVLRLRKELEAAQVHNDNQISVIGPIYLCIHYK